MALMGNPFRASNASTVNLSVTASTGNVALTGTGRVIRVLNTGTKTAYLALGNGASTEAAVATGLPLLTLQEIYLQRNAGPVGSTGITENYLAAICGGTDTTTLYVTLGDC